MENVGLSFNLTFGSLSVNAKERKNISSKFNYLLSYLKGGKLYFSKFEKIFAGSFQLLLINKSFA